MKRLLFFAAAFLAWAHPVHGALFYEFNPDYGQSFLVASSETVSEVFLPLNDYLGALDFWVSNGGIAGDATFTLYNANSTVIAERTIAVPAITDSETGTRFRVSLPSQIAVTGNAAYRVRIATSVPSFRLYFANATRLLATNGVPLPAYTGGLARIGSDDMAFSFKFALYENQESTAPQLTNVVVTQQTPTRAVITFNANEPVDRRMQYGSTTIDYVDDYASCAPAVQSCSVTLTVSPATTYNFTLTVRDVWGNPTTSTGTFTTLSDGSTPTATATPTPTLTATPTTAPTATPDTRLPVITNARLVSVTDTSATFAWTTNKATNSLVVVQELPYLLSAGGQSDNTMELEHRIVTNALPSDTRLRAKISSSDTLGNSVNTSIDFMTAIRTPTPTASTVSSPTAVAATPTPTAPIVSGTGDNQTIAWSAPASGEPSDGYRIDIFDSQNNLIKSITVAPGEYQTILGTLPAGDNRIVIYANDGGVFEKIAAPTSTKTPSPASFTQRLVAMLPYALGGIVLIILIAAAVTKFRKSKTPAATPPTIQPEMKTGARPNPSQL